jgi:indole-3-glycerol phosphate synthase
MTILDEIIAHKRAEELPRLPPVDRAVLRDLPPCRGFRAALARPAGARIRVIAECKRASPSKGILVADYDPLRTAFEYVHGGAAAISVLTDERFFRGALAHLTTVRAAVPVPCIRKDFIVDARQIAEARLAGADAILLIAACLGDGELRDLMGFARDLGLDVLTEVATATEAMRAVALGCDPIGVNNRDLHTFRVSLQTTFDLLPLIKGSGRIAVAESGITARADCAALEHSGADAVLVGETLMKSADRSAALRALRGEPATSALA